MQSCHHRIVRSQVLGILVCTIVVSGLFIPASAMGAEKPNIVFIFADDLGWTDVGCFGTEFYETPNIDRLANEGIRFTNAYTCAPNCAPTRACLMSGRYTPRHGIYTVSTGTRGLEKFRKLVPVKNQTELPLKETTLADVMKKAGYATGMFGKWHLGDREKHHPSMRGFDEAVVTSGRHFAPRFKTNPKTDVPDGQYLAEFLTDRAVDFIERHKEKPFFLYLPHFAVHTPIEAPQSLVSKYKAKAPVGGHHDPVYAGMVTAVDNSVGRVLAKLEEAGLTKNTLVIFYSDNGGHGGYGNLGGSTGKNITDNAPLRGGKGMLYEGGIRVPLIVRWPEVVKKDSVCEEPVISVDFLPTFAELAGVQNASVNELDGLSLASLLEKSGKGGLERKAIYWHFPGYLQANSEAGTWRTTPAGAIRSGNYKLIEFFEDSHVELYDLANDISETTDLTKTRPAMAKELHDQLLAWRARVKAPMPTPKK